MNCPNCGAPINNGKCDYCGTILSVINSDVLLLHFNQDEVSPCELEYWTNHLQNVCKCKIAAIPNTITIDKPRKNKT